VRLARSPAAGAFLRTASLGYAVPGTVVAIGLLPVVRGFEGAVDSIAGRLLGASSGLFFLGSGAAIVYA
jgi:iron(III) transport system permease protein